MKKLTSTLLAISALFALSSCEELEKLGDIDLGIPFEKTIPVNLAVPTALDGSATFTYGDTLRLIESSEVEPYLDVIKEVNIKSIKAQVTNFIGDPDVDFTGNILLNNEFSIGIDTLTLAENAEVVLEDKDGAYFKIAQFLLNQKEVNYAAELRVSKVPVEFDLKLIFEVEIKASAIEAIK